MGNSMPNKSKYFRVAVEGSTIDGRTIERSWLTDIAQTYDQNVYGARIWCEHLRSMMPDSVFGAYGDVIAVKTEEVEINGEKKLALFAQIEATPQLVELNKKSQKIYTSIEVNPKFADTGKAYLEGLGVTDTPASLGTEKLQFSSMAGVSFGKNSKENCFSVAIETALEFEDEQKSMFSGLIQKFSDLLKPQIEAQGKDAQTNFTEIQKVLEKVAETFSAQDDELKTVKTKNQDLEQKYSTLETKFTELDNKFHNTKDPNHRDRPGSTGHTGSTSSVTY